MFQFSFFDWWGFWNLNFANVDVWIFLVNTQGQKKFTHFLSWAMSKCFVGVTEIDNDHKNLHMTHRITRISDPYNSLRPSKAYMRR